MRRPIRLARVIGRLNIGGPAVQAISLTSLLAPLGYETLLIAGTEDPHEGSMDDLVERYGVSVSRVPAMRRDVGPRDWAAVRDVRRLLAEFEPDVVHTHAAKAGTVGRVAAAALRTRPSAVVHTYHGHSLEGYFSPRKSAVFRRVEQVLAHTVDRLVAVSPEVRDDLVRLKVAHRDRFSVVPLGFDLDHFRVGDDERASLRRRLRAELGFSASAPVVTLVARLAPIKRVDRFVDIAAIVASANDQARFVVVGDGELRDSLEAQARACGLDGRVAWTGFRRDIREVSAASDVVVLTSDNEGTPVSLIEAQATGTPVVATRVGGAATVVDDGRTGHLVEPPDTSEFAARTLGLLADREAARAMGARGVDHVHGRFGLDRLVADVDALYRDLLERAPGGGRRWRVRA